MLVSGKSYKVVSKSPYLKRKYGDSIVAYVEDTDVNIWGKSWMFMDGNPAALCFAMRTGLELVPFSSEPVWYCKIKPLEGFGTLGELLLENEIGEEVDV